MDSFSYLISDGNGGVAGALVLIDVISIPNQSPVVTGPVSSTATEDAAAYSIGLLTGASDPDGDMLSVSGLALQSGNGVGITVSGNNLNINPNAYNYLAVGEQAVIVFTYNVIDGNGGSVAQSATITITGVNDPSVANNDVGVTSEDTAVTINVFANDSDPDNSDILAIASFGQGSNGTVTQVGNDLLYTPNSNFNGSDSFTYSLVGGGTATVSIVVTSVNDAPVVTNQTLSINENSISGAVVGTVVATDVDLGQTLTYAISGPGSSNFVINPATGQITVAPGASLDFETTPSYTLTLVATDNGLPVGSASATLVINLNDIADELGPRISSVKVSSTAWSNLFKNFVDGGFATPAASGYLVSSGPNQARTIPWINVNQILISFTEDVSSSLSLADFQIVGIAGQNADGSTGGIPMVNSFTYDSATNTAILTLNKSFEAARLDIKISSNSITDSNGNPLNGEWTNFVSTGNSGNATEGGDFSFRINALPADVVGTNEIVQPDDLLDVNNRQSQQLFDLGFTQGATPTYSQFADVNGDGTINSDDSTATRNRTGSKLLQPALFGFGSSSGNDVKRGSGVNVSVTRFSAPSAGSSSTGGQFTQIADLIDHANYGLVDNTQIIKSKKQSRVLDPQELIQIFDDVLDLEGLENEK